MREAPHKYWDRPEYHIVRRYRAGVLRMSVQELEEACEIYGEYSCSLPSGTFEGKFWLCDQSFGTSAPPRWWLRQYVAHPTNPRMMSIRSKPIHVEVYEDGLRRLVGAPG